MRVSNPLAEHIEAVTVDAFAEQRYGFAGRTRFRFESLPQTYRPKSNVSNTASGA